MERRSLFKAPQIQQPPSQAALGVVLSEVLSDDRRAQSLAHAYLAKHPGALRELPFDIVTGLVSDEFKPEAVSRLLTELEHQPAALLRAVPLFAYMLRNSSHEIAANVATTLSKNERARELLAIPVLLLQLSSNERDRSIGKLYEGSLRGLEIYDTEAYRPFVDLLRTGTSFDQARRVEALCGEPWDNTERNRLLVVGGLAHSDTWVRRCALDALYQLEMLKTPSFLRPVDPPLLLVETALAFHARQLLGVDSPPIISERYIEVALRLERSEYIGAILNVIGRELSQQISAREAPTEAAVRVCRGEASLLGPSRAEESIDTLSDLLFVKDAKGVGAVARRLVDLSVLLPESLGEVIVRRLCNALRTQLELGITDERRDVLLDALKRVRRFDPIIVDEIGKIAIKATHAGDKQSLQVVLEAVVTRKQDEPTAKQGKSLIEWLNG